MSPSTETPFIIQVPDSELELLRKKLAVTAFPDELDEAGWEYGVPLADVKRLVARWGEGYDWRRHERQLNEELPQFKRDIEVDGFGPLGVHYVHKRSEVADAIPLLFVHGWPGSFLEVRKILPLLTEASQDHPCFHVVAFSLPGYGFSDAPKKKRFIISQFAEIGNKLMLALGYNEYVTQGGDIGYMVTRRIASLYGGEHSKAWHTNFQGIPIAIPPTFRSSPTLYLSNLFTTYTQAEKAGLERTAWFQQKGRGYSAEQSTQPQTLGYGLADSPSGLLAWIYEKLVNWTDGYNWEADEVLTWVSIYWFSTAGPAASVRIYYERMNEKYVDVPPKIPHGLSYFPKELINVPRAWTRHPYLVFEVEHDSGGHFAAHEKPQELVDDLRKMFGKDGPAYGVVEGQTGYGGAGMRSSL